MLSQLGHDGLAVISNDIVSDKSKFASELKNHDGVILIDRENDTISFGRSVESIESYLNDAQDNNKYDIAWHDSVQRIIGSKMTSEAMAKAAEQAENKDFGANDRLKGVFDYKIQNMNSMTATMKEHIQKVTMNQSIGYAAVKDGGFHPIDYDLLGNPESFLGEAAKHDGLMFVMPETKSIAVAVTGKGVGDLYKEACSRGPDKLKSGEINADLVWYDTLERQIGNELVSYIEKQAKLEAAKEQIVTKEQTVDKTLEPRSAASQLKGKTIFNDINCIAVWKDKDVTYNKSGQVTGAYVDVQLDQSSLTLEQINKGQGYSSPSLHCSSNKDPKCGMNQVWYTKKQLDIMQKFGSTADMGDTHGCSFTSNLMSKTNSKTGQKTTIVLLPKEYKEGMSAEDEANVSAYNHFNQVKPSIHGDFIVNDLKQQFAVTNKVRSMTEFNVDKVQQRESETSYQVEQDMQFE